VSPAIRNLFDQLGDALLIVGRDGLVKFANRVAASMLNAVTGAPLPSPVLQRAVASAAGGHLDLPHVVQFESGGSGAEADQLSATLMPSPVGTDFVLVMHNRTQESFYRTVVENLLGLVQRTLGEPVEAFGAAAGNLEATAAADPALAAAASEMLRLGREIAGRVQKLAGIATAFSGEPLLGTDRLPVDGLVEDALRNVAALAAERNVRVTLPPNGTALPVIYGNRKWLSRAIVEYLENAVRHAPGGSHVEVLLMRQGAFVRLVVRNVGLAPSRGTAQRAFLAFNGAANPEAASLGIGLALAARVIDAHGGRTHVDSDASDAANWTSFILELPTGAPKQDTTQLDIDQAKRYAADMSRLLQRRRAGPATKTHRFVETP